MKITETLANYDTIEYQRQIILKTVREWLEQYVIKKGYWITEYQKGNNHVHLSYYPAGFDIKYNGKLVDYEEYDDDCSVTVAKLLMK